MSNGYGNRSATHTDGNLEVLWGLYPNSGESNGKEHGNEMETGIIGYRVYIYMYILIY